MIRVASLAMVLSLAGCAATQTMGGPRAAGPDDTFSCYVRTLAQMEYRVENTDRGSEFILAVKENSGLFSGEYVNEATIMIVPATDALRGLCDYASG